MAKHKLSPYAADPTKRGETVRKGKRSTRSVSNASPAPAVTWPDPPAGWFRAWANKRTAMYRKSYGTTLGAPSLIVGKRRKGKPDRWVVSTVRRVPHINEAGEYWGGVHHRRRGSIRRRQPRDCMGLAVNRGNERSGDQSARQRHCDGSSAREVRGPRCCLRDGEGAPAKRHATQSPSGRVPVRGRRDDTAPVTM